MPKSKDAFRTISEVAEWLETPAHVLRFWESKFTQVKPVKRAGGRRYYRPADMQLLGGIKKLLHDDGLTIKGAQKLLREHGVKHVAALSQPLDDDLLEDDSIVQEAAYEPDAKPEPLTEEPATVLSFPSRAEPKTPAPAETTVPIAEPTATATPPETSEVSATEREETSHDRAGDAPAFGSDALPAFLRRSPAQPPQVSDDELADDEIDVEEEEDVAAAPASTPEKVTINPTAYLEPIEQVEDTAVDAASATIPDVAPERAPEIAKPTPQPMFSHSARASDGTRDEEHEEITEPAEPEIAEPAAALAAPAIDVPSAAKVAPTLESFEAKPGVLAALPGARRISPALASELTSKLTELRALRDRMQNH